MKNPAIAGWIAIILMFLLGALRSAGGVILILNKNLTDSNITASPNAAVVCGIGLLFIGLAEIISAIGIAAGNRSFVTVGILCTVLFVIDGLINGYILYGSPLEAGTIANLAAASVIISLLLFRIYKTV